MEPKVKLYMKFDGSSELALSIPIEKCKALSLHPLKWLRYVGYAIYGQEGDIYLSNDGEPVPDYTSDIQACDYYFISPHPPRLVDFSALDDRTSMATSGISQVGDFRDRVEARDGTCVMTGARPVYCHAVHILPRPRFDDYMSALISIRSGPDNDLQLESIDDPRNGLLLHRAVHNLLSLGFLAFLQTPNFAMDVNDVPYLGPAVNVPSRRLTMQLIRDVDDPVFLSKLGNNLDARQPDDISKWPPAVVLDFFYGCAALREWGSRNFHLFVKEHNLDDYYKNSKTTAAEKYDKKEPRIRRRNSFDDTMDMVLGIWMFNARKCQQKQEAEHIPKVDHSPVNDWLSKLED